MRGRWKTVEKTCKINLQSRGCHAGSLVTAGQMDRRFVSNSEQRKLLEGIMKQIEEAVPQVTDLANELTQYPQQYRSGGMQLY